MSPKIVINFIRLQKSLSFQYEIFNMKFLYFLKCVTNHFHFECFRLKSKIFENPRYPLSYYCSTWIDGHYATICNLNHFFNSYLFSEKRFITAEQRWSGQFSVQANFDENPVIKQRVLWYQNAILGFRFYRNNFRQNCDFSKIFNQLALNTWSCVKISFSSDTSAIISRNRR